MKLFYQGIEIEADYTRRVEGARSRGGIKTEPDTPAEIDISSVKLASQKLFINYLYEKCYDDLLDQANGIAYCEREEAAAEALRQHKLMKGVTDWLVEH